MPKIVTKMLSDRFVRHFKYGGPEDRISFRDKKVPALILVVTAKGAKSYVIKGRIPPRRAPSTRRTLGIARR